MFSAKTDPLGIEIKRYSEPGELSPTIIELAHNSNDGFV